jgi:CRISPR system Cascade subunit CasE
VRFRLDTTRLLEYGRAIRRPAERPSKDLGELVRLFFSGLLDLGVPPEDRVAPQPFCITAADGRCLDVAAYSALSHHELIEEATARARANVNVATRGICTRIESSPMPVHFAVGTRWRFSARVCPIRRIGHREVDAYVARCDNFEGKIPLVREDVYRAWIDEELDKEHAARVVSATVTDFHLRRMVRMAGSQTLPDVTADGLLEVTDSDAFHRRLVRGLGRHRAYGFGMILLYADGDA